MHARLALVRRCLARLLGAAWLLAPLPACPAYNSQCTYEESVTLGYSDVPLDIRPVMLRAREAPAGNLVADAIMRAALDEATDRADLAVIPAGAFSTATPCGPRDELPLGILTSADIAHLLGLGEPLVVLELQPPQVKAMLERSVAALGDRVAELEAVHFLQVSAQLNFEVNCDNLAWASTPDGTVRPGARVDARVVYIGGVSLEAWSGRPIYLVTTEALAGGILGYDDLGQAPIVRRLGVPLHVAVGKHIDRLSPLRAEDVVTSSVPAGVDGQRGRIRTWPNCMF